MSAPEKVTVVGHIVEVIDKTGLVEIEEPAGSIDNWKSHVVPQSMIEGHVKIEIGEYVAVEVRDYGSFAVGNARPLTEKEDQYLRQRFAKANAELQEKMDELEESGAFDDELL